MSQRLVSDTEIVGILSDLLERVELQQDGICITLSLKPLMPVDAKTDSILTLTRLFPMQMKRRGVEMRLVIDDGGVSAKADPTLIKTIAQAQGWFQELASRRTASLVEIAQREGIDRSYISHSLKYAFLAPDIVEAIIAGKQPTELTTHALRCTDLPLAWSEQQRILGFAHAHR